MIFSSITSKKLENFCTLVYEYKHNHMQTDILFMSSQRFSKKSKTIRKPMNGKSVVILKSQQNELYFYIFFNLLLILRSKGPSEYVKGLVVTFAAVRDELVIASFVLLSLCETIVALTDAVAALITAAAVNALNRAVNISLRARSCRAATAAAVDEAFEVVVCVLYRCACWLLLFVFCWSVGVIGAENMGSNSNGGVDVDVEISDESFDLLHILVADACGTTTFLINGGAFQQNLGGRHGSFV
ncbi:hypothetical protein GQX74_013172 [Glossina fuscipes]|nr:hypothetical protein GQX74_013172 [Glossina fuscipes]